MVDYMSFDPCFNFNLFFFSYQEGLKKFTNSADLFIECLIIMIKDTPL